MAIEMFFSPAQNLRLYEVKLAADESHCKSCVSYEGGEENKLRGMIHEDLTCENNNIWVQCTVTAYRHHTPSHTLCWIDGCSFHLTCCLCGVFIGEKQHQLYAKDSQLLISSGKGDFLSYHLYSMLSDGCQNLIHLNESEWSLRCFYC